MNPTSLSKLQHVYSKHAVDFGISDAWNPANGDAFEQVLHAHVNNSAVTRIVGTYRGTLDVTHFYDPASHLNVIVNTAGDLISAWRLSVTQVAHLLASGNIQ